MIQNTLFVTQPIHLSTRWLKHSLFRHLWRRLKIPQHKHDPGSAQDGRTNIYMYDILEPAKKIDQCVPWSVASNQSGAWCLGRQSRRCSRYFDLHVACKVCLVFFFAKCSCCAFCLCARYDFCALCSICDFLLWSNMAYNVHHAKNGHMLPTVQWFATPIVTV